jgi:hypothetical protein
MFYALHRALKLMLFCAVAAVAWQIHKHREIFEPTLIWYDVWDNGGFEVKNKMPAMTGSVERVLNSQTFVLKSTNSIRSNVRLLGLKDPPKELSIDSIQKEKDRKQALQDIIEGKNIQLDVGYENMNNVGGIVYIDKTNVNAQLVRQRLAFTSKDLLKGFPKELQYQMLWSKRHAITNTVADARVP